VPVDQVSPIVDGLMHHTGAAEPHLHNERIRDHGGLPHAGREASRRSAQLERAFDGNFGVRGATPLASHKTLTMSK
jgi:hypothetical protein